MRAGVLPHTRSRFFVAMAILLLVAVAIGFAPTFYLKAFFETPDLPWYLHVHGATLTAWFVLFVTQTALIAANRTALHRRLGVLMGVIAGFVILTTLLLILGANASTEVRGIVRPNPIEFVVLGDLGLLISFVILVGVGVFSRHRPALHKRAMLLATVALVVPALTRAARFPVFGEAGPAFLAAPFVLMSALWVHDLLTDKRLHAATAWGSALIFCALFAASSLARTEAGKAFVAAISLASPFPE